MFVTIFFHMNPLALTKAHSRLRVASKAVDDLASCKNYEAFTDIWYTFLVAAKSVYTVLEQGTKDTPQARQWYGAKKQERRGDPLLCYLFHARDDDEHGLRPVSEHVAGQVSIGKSAPGYSSAMRFDGGTGPGLTMNVTALDGLPVLIEHTPPHARLVRVYDRDPKTFYDPPTQHKGQILESNLPLPVAKLAITYLGELIAEAASIS